VLHARIVTVINKRPIKLRAMPFIVSPHLKLLVAKFPVVASRIHMNSKRGSPSACYAEFLIFARNLTQ